MKRHERIITIIMLVIISLSNLTTPAVYAAQLVVTKFPIPGTKISKAAQFAPRPKFSVDAGSVLGASTSLLTVGSQSLDLGQGTGMSANKRIPVQMQQLPKKVYRTNEDVTLAVTNPDNEAFTTTVQDAAGQGVQVPITESNNGNTTTVDLSPSDSIKPGQYKITVTDQNGVSNSQDFSWGVLALNTDKSLYHPDERANISMAVLDDQGNMVCDAKVQLLIQSPNLQVDDSLSTQNGKIIVNPQCQKHDFSLQPDYEAQYQFGKSGMYQFKLTATTHNGSHTITDAIQVKDSIPFDVQRVSATRIYPPNTYPMTFNIKANQAFTGTVTETVPDSFTITPATESAQTTSYTDMQTVYLNSNDPATQLGQAIAASSSGGLVMPFHGTYPITQGFGAQLTDPTLQAFYTQYGLAGHDGIDFGVPMNTPLYAVDSGVIMQAGPGVYGTTIIIQHSWGESYYGHLLTTAVKVGDAVTKGQLIGYSGMSGEATGPHLHFGMKPLHPDMTNGYYGKVDPMSYLPIGQNQPVATLGASANPVAKAVYDTTVLGASDAATTPTPSIILSTSPTVSPTTPLSPTAVSASSTTAPMATVTPAPTTGTVHSASQSAVQSTVPSPTASPTPTPVTTVSTTPPANTNITVLQKQILLDEQLANSALTEKVKIITWHVSLKKGQSTSLGYDFQAPHVSPQFYLLGPVHFYDNSGKIVFQEQRQWQIASDDVGVEWYQNTSGSSFNGYSWQYRKKIDIDHTKVVGTPYADANSGIEQGNGTSLGWSQTVSSAGNCILIVPIAIYGDSAQTVTDNGTDLTKLSTTALSSNYSSGEYSHSEIWYISPAPAGTNNITVSYSASEQFVTGSASFCGVDTSSPFGTAVANNGYGTATGSLSVTTVANQLVFDSFSFYGIAGPWTSSQQTLWSGDTNNGGGASYTTSSAGTTNISWSSTGGSETWADVAVPINPAVGVSYTPVFMDSGGDATHDTTSELQLYDGTGGTPATVDCSVSETGHCSLKFVDSINGSYMYKQNILSDSGRRVSAYFKLDALPSDGHDLFYLADSGGGTGILEVNITPSGVLQLADNGTQLGSNGMTLSTGTWYRIDISYVINSATNYAANVYVNGVKTISYSQSSGGTTLAATGTSDLFIGLSVPFTGVGDSIVEHMDDIYVDSGSDLSDTGDVHVTNKRPYANGAYNTYSTQIGSGGSGYGSGHAPQVNEQPLNTSNGWESSTRSTPTYDTSNTFDEGSANGTNSWTTGSFTVNTGHTNDYLLVGILDRQNLVKPQSISYGDQVLSFIGEGNVGGSTNNYFLYGLTAPPTGSHTFTVTYSNTTSWYTMIAESWYNVDQITPYGSFATTAGTSGTISVTLSPTVSGRVGVDFIWSSAYPQTPSQQVIQNTNVSGGGGMIGSSYLQASGTSVTLSWGTSGGWGSKAIDLIGAPQVEEYTLESASSGDVDISSYSILGDEAWLSVQDTAACTTNKIINNGITTTFTNTGGGYKIITNTAAMTSYPSGGIAVGEVGCEASDTSDIAEAGVMFAYIPITPVSNSLSNFPVLVNLSSDSSLKAHAQSSGADILFTDSTGKTLLPFELESYNSTTGSLQAWVKISSLSANNDTIIYMYYGNPSASSQANVTSVWDANYQGVWHLPSNGGVPSVSDSTSNNTATNYSTTTTTGEIGNGAAFNGSSQYIDLGGGSGINPGTNVWTVEMWYKSTSMSFDQALLEDGVNASNGYEIAFDESPCGTSQPLHYKVSKFGVADICVGTVPNDSNWHFLVIVYRRTGETAYVDGTAGSCITACTDSNFIVPSTQHAFLGSYQGTSDYLHGAEDEVRISNIARSPAWIQTEYNNQSTPSTFYSLGNEETDIYAPTLSQVLGHGEWFNSAGVKQPFVF